MKAWIKMMTKIMMI